MNTQLETSNATKHAAVPIPPLIEFHLVQGACFRCVAYRDHHGIWRDALNNQELFGEITVIEQG